MERLKPKYGFFGHPPRRRSWAGWDDQDVLEAGMDRGARPWPWPGSTSIFAPVADVNVNPESPAIGKLGPQLFPGPPHAWPGATSCFLQGMAPPGHRGLPQAFSPATAARARTAISAW